MFLGNYPWKLLLPEHAKRKRQASVRDCTKSTRRRFWTQDVCYLERHLTTLPHETIADIVSNSKLESLYSSLIDNEEILQCFLNLPCCLLNNEKEKRPKKRRKHSVDTHSLAYNGHNHFCDSNAEHWYLDLPEDMVEDNLLDLENIMDKQDETIIFKSH